MTEEVYEKCLPWEQQFRWAVRSNFLHLTNREFGEIANLYKEAFNEELTPRQKTCNTCRLKAMTRLGNEFFAYQQELAKKQKEEALNEDPEPEKKKGGRKKKIDLN